jgi:hypothetical protein
MAPKSALDRVRELCLSLPETSERLSHGQPSFFIRDKKTFVMYLDNHHGDGRLALWLAAPRGMQEALVESAPEHYFRPPYVAIAAGSASASTAVWHGTRSPAPSRTPTSPSPRSA